MSNNDPVEELRRQYPTILTTAHMAEMMHSAGDQQGTEVGVSRDEDALQPASRRQDFRIGSRPQPDLGDMLRLVTV